MPAAKTIRGSVVPATRRARRTGKEGFGTQGPASIIWRRLRQTVASIGKPQKSAKDFARGRFGGHRPYGAKRQAGPGMAGLKIAVGYGCVNHGAQFAPDRIGARRRHLGAEKSDQVFPRI